MKSVSVLILLFVAVAAPSAYAQDRSECDQLRAAADESVQRSNDRPLDRPTLDVRARNQILKMDDACKDETLKGQYEPIKDEIEERLAERNFGAAKYYFNLYRAGKATGVKGAEARFREIIEKYVHYSKLDEVLILLGRSYMIEHQPDDAATTFTELIRKYPASPLAYKAQTYLDRLAAQPPSR